MGIVRMSNGNRAIVPVPSSAGSSGLPQKMSAFVRILSRPRISPLLRPSYNLPDHAHLSRITVNQGAGDAGDWHIDV
jgi:hypothetical protein